MKTILTITLALITLTFSAQNYKFIDSNLHLMNDKEMIENQVQMNGVTMYDTQGNKIDSSQVNDIMMSGNFMPQVFGNAKHQAKAIVFRSTTSEEKKAMRDSMNHRDPNASFVSGKPAKDFNTTDINTKPIALKNYLGKIVVLNFWYPDCPDCMSGFSKLNTLKNKYPEVVFINVTFESKASVQSTLTSYKLDFIQITDNEKILKDYEIVAFPTHIIIDQTGKIMFRKIGNFIDKMDRRIELLLK